MDIDRTLASIVKITHVNPIENADAIELATVLGWNVVVKKHEFKVGDLGIYFSIDSVLDISKQYSLFLAGKPLKTKKIRGVISQGLLGPLEWLKEHNLNINDFKEGDDVTKLLNVIKYIHPTEEYIYNVNENGRSPFPSFVPKTDEERVQNIPEKLERLKNKLIVITKKFDGTSSTFVFNGNNQEDKKFMICSRNNAIINVGEKNNLHFFEIEKKYNLKEKMDKLNRNIAIQGEICGPKINCNRLKMKENDLFVFNIYDIDSRKYLLWDEVLVIVKELGLKTVNVVYNGLMKEEWLKLPNLLDLADSQKYDCGDLCEGIVLKTDDPFGRISFKVISNKFLLKHNL